MKRSATLSILCFLILSLTLLIFFSFSLSLRVVAFFIFNFISLSILIGSPMAEVEGVVSMPLLYEEEDHGENNWDGSDVVDVEGYHGYDAYDEDNDDDLDTADVDSEDDEGNDQLERRTEEFIAKVTAKWREEFLKERILYITDSS
ncbi:hypothetical protein SLE2022_026670 [Rubroshorea leprosula]